MESEVSFLNNQKLLGNEETIRDIAVKLLESKIKLEEHSGKVTSRAIFIVGAKSCGKTSLMNKFLERNESESETLTLEYSYGRKNITGQFADKNICHIWELGGSTFQTPDIVSVPLTAHNVLHTTVLIMVDLSQPSTLWLSLESAIDKLKSAVEKLPEISTLKEKSKERAAKHYADMYGRNVAEIFPLPILIVGGKYDLFKDMDPNYKSLASRTLRSAAQLLGASLFFYSNKDPALVKRSRQILNYLGFGIGDPMKGAVKDANKPVFISPGSDSWESIGTTQSSWDSVKSAYCSQHPGVALGASVPPDPTIDVSYRDPIIDSLRLQKDQELQLWMGTAMRNYL